MTEDRRFRESNLCSLGTRPQQMTALFVSELRKFFADSDNLQYETFRNRTFTQVAANADATGILIEDNTVWTPTRTQKRPGIIVKRNAWQHMKRLTLANTGINTRGEKGHTTLWRGSHTLFCIAPEGAECEILGAETFEYLMWFSEEFRKHFKLLMFELSDIGPPSALEETDTHYVVPLTVLYGWSESWVIRKHQPPLVDERLQQIFDDFGATQN